ncbi:hypothetical protein ACN27G_05900 [Plantactinospora sp. WMMB334]|uniref:hypothetical protein n=1 Tax=Plantactinospora sp. WMMB334 TaxID=3404119 RepID=UPI003B92E740
MVLHTPFAEHHEAARRIDQPQHVDRHTYTATVPTIAACGAAALALIFFDLFVSVQFPPELRGLALVVILTSAVVNATMWIDHRNEARHQELLATRRPGDCCAIAWVDGRAGRPFPSIVAPYQSLTCD